MSTLAWVGLAAVTIAVLAFVVMGVRGKRRVEEKKRESAQALDAADAALADTAARQGWSHERRPSPGLWYRMSGTTPRGITWVMVETPPSVIFGDVKGGGVRWSTDDVQAPQLMFELMPSALYNRMKAYANVGEWDGEWSSALKKVVTDGHVVPLPNRWLAERFTLVSIAPKLADRLFSDEVLKAFEALRSGSWRVSFGFPNLRVVCDDGGATPDFLVKLVEAATTLAHRAREPEAVPDA